MNLKPKKNKKIINIYKRLKSDAMNHIIKTQTKYFLNEYNQQDICEKRIYIHNFHISKFFQILQNSMWHFKM